MTQQDMLVSAFPWAAEPELHLDRHDTELIQ